MDEAENPNAKDSDGFTLLLRLSQMPSWKCLSFCQRLEQKGVDINTCSTNGESALHLAIKNNNWPVVEFLLNRGVQFNVQALEQMHTIHRLIKYSTSVPVSDQLRLMTLLINIGLSITMPDLCGRTPAELALTHERWKLLKFLLGLGAQLNPTPRKGNSFFHELARRCFTNKQAAKITHLVNHVSGINLKNNLGDTPVHVVANEENWDVVKTLVEHGADPNILDRKGHCLLHKVVTNFAQNSSSSVQLVEALVKHGAEINWRGPNGKTALQLAASIGKWHQVVALNELGAICKLTPKEKLSAFKFLHYLTWRNEKKLKLFINYITNNVSESDVSNRFNKKYRYQKALLQKCVKRCNWMMTKALVECGAEVSLILENKALLQLIMSRSSMSDHTAWTHFFDLLISKGLDINARLENQSPFLFSDEVIRSLICEKEVTKCLFCACVKRGANPLIADWRGLTLLRRVMDFSKHGTLNALKKLLPTGVTTHQPKFTEAILRSEGYVSASPTERAIQVSNICALKMLIGSGASSNAELFYLNTEYQVKLAVKADTNDDVRELLDVLNKAASQPHSLTSLCCFTVSHLLGCGPCRPDKIKHLPIPCSVRSLISFSDLLLPEFLSQKHEDAHASLSDDNNDFISNNDYSDSESDIPVETSSAFSSLSDDDQDVYY